MISRWKMIMNYTLFFMGDQNQTNPIENRKPNRTKQKTTKNIFSSDEFESFFNRTLQLGSVWGLYFAKWIKLNYVTTQTSLNLHPTKIQTYYVLVLWLQTIFSSSDLGFQFHPCQIFPASITSSLIFFVRYISSLLF